MQDELAAQEPDHPMHAFGEAVEVASGSGGPVAEQLARACTQALTLALPDLLGRLTQHIDDLHAVIESVDVCLERHCVISTSGHH